MNEIYILHLRILVQGLDAFPSFLVEATIDSLDRTRTTYNVDVPFRKSLS